MRLCKLVVGVLMLALAIETAVEAAPVVPGNIPAGMQQASRPQFQLVRRRRRKKPVKKTSLTSMRALGAAS